MGWSNGIIERDLVKPVIDPSKVLRDRLAAMKVRLKDRPVHDDEVDEGDPSSLDYPSLDPPAIKSVESTKKRGRGFQP